MRPESRKSELLTQSVGDELVIYDERSHEAHHLSPTAAVVWRAADGERSVPELSSILRESLNATPLATPAVSDEDGEELVRLALDELDRVGLLVRGLPGLGELMSRREMIGAAAALIPVVMSIVAPTPAMAQTPGTTPFNFGPFNGTYTGNGTPGTPNACGISARPVTLQLNISGVTAAGGVGSLNINHVGAQAFSGVPMTATVETPIAIRVTGNGQGGVYTTTNTFTFVLLTTGATASGTQSLIYAECGTTPYNITATKP